MLEKLDVLRAMRHGYDYSGWLGRAQEPLRAVTQEPQKTQSQRTRRTRTY